MKNNPARIVQLVALSLAATLSLGSCGGGSSGTSSSVAPSSAPTYSIGGSVTGLVSGTSVLLQDNGGTNTPVSVNASFSFSTTLATGSAYAVAVLTQPTGEVCAVTNGSGTVGTAEKRNKRDFDDIARQSERDDQNGQLRGMNPAILSRRVEVQFFGVNLRFVSREDLIAMKCFAGAPQDLLDA